MIKVVSNTPLPSSLVTTATVQRSGLSFWQLALVAVAGAGAGVLAFHRRSMVGS